MTRKISVVIVAYKDGETLRNTLDSIAECNDIGDSLEVIVVDNSPEGERVDRFVSDSRVRDVIYVKGDNFGFGEGNNRGASQSSGEILAFLNPDIILVEPLFKDIYERFKNNKDLMMLGCQLLDRDCNKTYSFFYDFEDSQFKKIMTKVRNRYGLYNQKDMFTSGCNMFIRKEAFLKAGCFDENIFMYNEEADIRRRIMRTFPQCKVVFDKDHSLIHIGGSRLFSEQRFKLLKNSLICFSNKYGLNYRKKFLYEYRIDKFKHFVFSVLNKADKIDDLKKEIAAFEKYYPEIVLRKAGE